ncbi:MULTISPECIES: ABC transporter permease [Paenibacillus]|uniref:ABC transporter permease n=1 Tax=Paenibacillus TaxID=44249 RepID=UPI00096D33F6|nr:ABC transporter permease [Paenibacillus odorifer]OME10986.1 ABC transporter permease [Paenibacillus odorifer]
MKYNSGKTVKKLAKRSLKSSKNYFAILAIALAAIMFTSVFTIAGSLLESMKDNKMRIVGSNAHGGFHQMSMPEYKRVSSDSKIKDISYSVLIGDAQGAAFSKLPTEVRYGEEKYAKWAYSLPQLRNMPQQKKDISVSTLVLDALGLPHTLGQSISVTFKTDKKTITDTFTVCGIWDGNPLSWRQNIWLSREYADLVAPVASEPWNNRSKVYSGYINSQFWFSNTWDIETKSEQLASRSDFNGQITVNASYDILGSEPQNILLGFLVISVISLAGYLLIYNIFYISIAQEIKSYGLLKVIGTTSKQIKRMVRYKAIYLACIGIPFGLVIGWTIGRFLVPAIIDIFGEDMRVVTSVHPLIFAIAAIFSLCTVLFSCLGPAKVASGVSPIEALSYVEGKQTGELRRKKKKAHPITSVRLAMANLKRNPRKVIIVTLSFTLSLVILNSTYGLVHSFDFNKFIEFQSVSDFTVADTSIINNSPPFDTSGVSNEFIKQVESLAGLEDSGNVYVLPLTQNLSDQAMSALKREVGLMNEKDQEEFLSSQEMVKRRSLVNTFGFSEWPAQMIQVKEGALDQKRWENGEGIYVTNCKKFLDGTSSIYHPGDKVKVSFGNGKEKEYEVLAIVDFPGAIHSVAYYDIGLEYLLPSDELLAHADSMLPMYTIFNVDDEHLTQTEKWLEDYCLHTDTGLDFYSKNTSRETFRSLIFMYEVVGGAFCILLGVIGILNFINSMQTSILTRKREIAMLQSIAMTDKQVKEMLIFEGVGYALLGLMFSIVLGSLANTTLVPAMGAELDYFTWTFTLTPILLSIIPFMLVSIVVPVLCYHSISKKTIIERLRSEVF